MIDLRTLNVFLTVSECGTFTLAAKRLEKTQSAVSQAIRQLEEALGVVLIDRASRPMALTPSGSVLREHAYRLIREAESLAVTVRDYGHSKVQEIRIGLVDSFAAAVGPALMKILLDHAVNLTVWSGLTTNLADALLQRKVDMIIANDALEDINGLDRHELMSEPYLLLAPASVAIDSTDASLATLARNHPMICYNPHSFLGAQIARQLHRRNIHATRRVSVDTSDSLVAMVAAGIGWTSTTPLCLLLGRPYLSRVTVVPFPEPQFFRRLVLLSRSGEYSALAGRLARIAIDILTTEVRAELKQLIPWFDDAATIKIGHVSGEPNRP
jgi:DNA-binding transcriptional LysR family regulator